MKEHTTFVDRNIFQKNLLAATKDLSVYYEEISSALTEDLVTLDSNTLHFAAKVLKSTGTGDPTQHKAFLKLLGRSVLRSETLAGGSGVLGLRFSIEFLRSLLSGHLSDEMGISDTILYEEYENILLKLKEIIQKQYQIPTIEDIEKQVKDICNEDLLSRAILESIKMAGLEGKIYLENGKQPYFVIERRTGYNFKVKPFKFFLGSQTCWERQNVRVLLVDGVIEQVSEIDQLLNEALRLGQPGIIVARGFSEEIIATLKINFDKGLLDILPIRINSDLESINILNDIASVCGTDIVSSLKGELLCFQRWENLALVQKVRCLAEQVSIEENKTRNNVISQVKNLLSKRLDNQNIEDVVSLIDERIKSLVSESVVVRLPDVTELENQTIRTKFDTSLRTVKAVLNNGLVRPADIIREFGTPKSVLEKSFLMGLNSLSEDNELVSSLALYLAMVICGKQALMIYTSNGAVIMDEMTQAE
jgi:hypothetical protein